MARRAGFNLGDEGPINGAWYLLMQKPTTAHSSRKDNAA
jgi:hypothetical protein